MTTVGTAFWSPVLSTALPAIVVYGGIISDTAYDPYRDRLHVVGSFTGIDFGSTYYSRPTYFAIDNFLNSPTVSSDSIAVSGSSPDISSVSLGNPDSDNLTLTFAGLNVNGDQYYDGIYKPAWLAYAGPSVNDTKLATIQAGFQLDGGWGQWNIIESHAVNEWGLISVQSSRHEGTDTLVTFVKPNISSVDFSYTYYGGSVNFYISDYGTGYLDTVISSGTFKHKPDGTADAYVSYQDIPIYADWGGQTVILNYSKTDWSNFIAFDPFDEIIAAKTNGNKTPHLTIKPKCAAVSPFEVGKVYLLSTYSTYDDLRIYDWDIASATPSLSYDGTVPNIGNEAAISHISNRDFNGKLLVAGNNGIIYDGKSSALQLIDPQGV